MRQALLRAEVRRAAVRLPPPCAFCRGALAAWRSSDCSDWRQWRS